VTNRLHLERTLVTGATGRIGRRFVQGMVDRGMGIRVLVRSAEQAERFEAGGVEARLGDLADDGSSAEATKGVDAVVHLAAAYAAQGDQEVPKINVWGSRRLAESAMDAGVRSFVLASSSLVYGPGRGRPAREGDPLTPSPTNEYAVSKVAEEATLRSLHRARGLPLRIIRLGFVYGDGDPHLAEAAGWAVRWPNARRLHMLHHHDASQILLAALTTESLDGAVVNAGDDCPITAWELRQFAARTVDELVSDPGDPWESVMDLTRLRTVLGIRPRYPTLYCAQHAGAL
jgi:nucleoside-diphosphate-sugar epimerase